MTERAFFHERVVTELADHHYTSEVVSKLTDATTIVIPRGEHVNPFCMEWLKPLDDIDLPSTFTPGKSGRLITEHCVYEQVRDSAIPPMINRPGAVGITALHQFLEYSEQLLECPEGIRKNLHATVVTTLKASRFVIGVRAEDKDYMEYLLGSSNPEDKEEIRFCAENRVAALEMLQSCGIDAIVDKVPEGSSEVLLGRRPTGPNDPWINPWNMGVFIRGKGTTLDNSGLVPLDIELPFVKLCVMWPLEEESSSEAFTADQALHEPFEFKVSASA